MFQELKPKYNNINSAFSAFAAIEKDYNSYQEACGVSKEDLQFNVENTLGIMDQIKDQSLSKAAYKSFILHVCAKQHFFTKMLENIPSPERMGEKANNLTSIYHCLSSVIKALKEKHGDYQPPMTGKSLLEYYDLLGKHEHFRKDGHGQIDYKSLVSLFRKAAIENKECPNLPDDLRRELACWPNTL